MNKLDETGEQLIFEMFDDSNYRAEEDFSGHPFSNPDELFASASVDFVNHADEFARNDEMFFVERT
jgi:hypothetical protein